MRTFKVDHPNGKDWITVVVEGINVVEVHSNGLIVNGSDDSADQKGYRDLFMDWAEHNDLHSQQPKRGGIRW